MSSQRDTLAERGVGGRLNWLVGGALGGLVGSTVFGIVLWVVDPAIVTELIPEIYGLEGGGPAGWVFHLVHGITLGIVFGFIVTREPVAGTLTADVETPFIDAMGTNARMVGAGLVYGLVIWVAIPGVILTIVVTVGGTEDPLPWGSVYSLVGHLLYGMLLGGLVSVFADLEREVRESDAPFEEATDNQQ